MTDWFEALFGPLGLPEYVLGVDLTAIASGDSEEAKKLQFSETHLKRALLGTAVIGGVIAAPYLYDMTASKGRSKRRKAKTAAQRAAIAQTSERVATGLKEAFKTPYLALPATIIALELASRVPGERVVHHPGTTYTGPTTVYTGGITPYYYVPEGETYTVGAYDETLPAGVIPPVFGRSMQIALIAKEVVSAVV